MCKDVSRVCIDMQEIVESASSVFEREKRFFFLADCGALHAVSGGDGEAELPPGKRL